MILLTLQYTQNCGENYNTVEAPVSRNTCTGSTGAYSLLTRKLEILQ